MAYEPKTTKTKASVTEFIAQQPREETRRDCTAVVKMMKRITGEPAAMWGPSMVGFGTWSYVYASGHSGDWPVAAFSPRKTDLTLYVTLDFAGSAALMKKLGKFKTGKVCLYLKSLADVDQAVLEELITRSVASVREKYPVVKAVKQATPARTAAKPMKKKAAKKRAVRKPAKSTALPRSSQARRRLSRVGAQPRE